jgi:hypothetical protein
MITTTASVSGRRAASRRQIHAADLTPAAARAPLDTPRAERREDGV